MNIHKPVKLGNQLRNQFSIQPLTQLNNQLYSQLRRPLYIQIYFQLDNQIWNQLRK